MAAPTPGSQLEQVLEKAWQVLGELGASCALVGGLAVSARAEPRFTRDVDLAISVDGDPEAERLLRDLRQNEQEDLRRLATVRCLPPGGEEHGVILDLLFASSGIEPEVVSSAQPIEVFPDLVVPVARVGELLALKVLARDDERRPQDVADLRALVREATEEDLDAARHALALIVERGSHRGRDLLVELEQIL